MKVINLRPIGNIIILSITFSALLLRHFILKHHSNQFPAPPRFSSFPLLRNLQLSRLIVEIPEYPAIFSAPMPAENSISYKELAYLDLLETSDENFYFMVHNRFDHLEAAIKIDDIMLEQEMTDKLHEPPESYYSSYFANKYSNEYPTIRRFDCYRTVEGSYQTMDFLSSKYPTLAEVIEIGPSYLKSSENSEKGHELQVLKVTNQESTKEKSPFFMICGIHPRELAPPEVCARFAEKITAEYGNDPDITWILDYTEIHIIMQANPDGRENEESNLCRFRRKNMHADLDGCPGTRFGGVDLNRNFPHPEWATVGVPLDKKFTKCRDNFQGSYAGSEPETRAIVKYLESVLPPGTNVKDPETGAYTEDAKGVLIDIHAHAEAFFWPYAYTKNLTSPNEEGFRAIAEKMASHTSNPEYTTNNNIYAVSGDTTDYAYGYLGIAAFTAEIGSAFHDKCSYFEESVSENLMRSLLYAARISKAPYLLSKGPEVMSLTLSKQVLSTDDSFILSAIISDSQRVKTSVTGVQNLRSIEVYFDAHPYDENSVPVAVNAANFTSSSKTFHFNFTISDGVSSDHTLYVRSYDENGPGPIYSKQFHVDNSLNSA